MHAGQIQTGTWTTSDLTLRVEAFELALLNAVKDHHQEFLNTLPSKPVVRFQPILQLPCHRSCPSLCEPGPVTKCWTMRPSPYTQRQATLCPVLFAFMPVFRRRS